VLTPVALVRAESPRWALSHREFQGLGQFKGGQYRYKEKIVNNGFAIKATPIRGRTMKRARG